VGSPIDVWEREGKKVRMKDRGGRTGAEPQDPCGCGEGADVAEALVLLQAGIGECGTRFQLVPELDAELGL